MPQGRRHLQVGHATCRVGKWWVTVSGDDVQHSAQGVRLSVFRITDRRPALLAGKSEGVYQGPEFSLWAIGASYLQKVPWRVGTGAGTSLSSNLSLVVGHLY
jgi:hypothetical protein